MNPPANSWRLRRTEHSFYAEIVPDIMITTKNSERKYTHIFIINLSLSLE